MNSIHNLYIESTKKWIEKFVIGLNLCPFAKKEFIANRIRYIVVEKCDEAELIEKVIQEFEYLDVNTEISTTLIILKDFLDDFLEFNDFHALIEIAVEEFDYEGVYQVAIFHPLFYFEDTEMEDVENYTNRSPFPVFHILREDSISKVVDTYENIEEIPDINIEKMNKMGLTSIKLLLDEIIRSN
jgi:uncharacterized protein